MQNPNELNTAINNVKDEILDTVWAVSQQQQAGAGPFPPIEWNPTQPDNPDPANEYVAEKILGLIKCGGWSYMNFGSAGGAALMKNCKHKDGECYSSRTTGNMMGKIGGCPEYNKHWTLPCADLIEHWRKSNHLVKMSFEPNGVWVEITEDVPWSSAKSVKEYGSTMELALVAASIAMHKALQK
jgi:hypothetical protein